MQGGSTCQEISLHPQPQTLNPTDYGQTAGRLKATSTCSSFILRFQSKKQNAIHSWKLTWNPEKGPIKTTVPLKGDLMGFHVSLGECS